MANHPAVSSLVDSDHCGVSAILSVLGDCTEAEHSDGRNWYAVANRFAHKVSTRTDKRIETVCAVIARLSPQAEWSDNKRAAIEVCYGRPVYGLQVYGDNVYRAGLIAEADTDEVIADQVLPKKGYARPKISMFYRNILNPANPTACTVDTWAARIWVGDCCGPSATINATDSARIQADYIAAAHTANLLPQQLQAITWVGAHRIRKERGQRSLFDIGAHYKI